MQIDFHHGTTYVLARIAGFDHRDAEIVAYCAQYIDDATNGGYVRFDAGQLYYRIASAHKMLDYRNFDELANRHVWLPFHFLPGNAGLPPGQQPPGGLIESIVCRPDSHVARDMLRMCIESRDKTYGLHRLGVSMHVYADTWAHQGFAGTVHAINRASDIHHVGDDARNEGWLARVGEYFSDTFDRVAGGFVDGVLPVGHGAVLSNPDLPFLCWNYRDGHGNRIERDNPRDYMEASEQMCRAMRRYRLGDADADVPGLGDEQRDAIENLIVGTDAHDGEERHRVWLDAIATPVAGSNDNVFGFEPQQVIYVPKKEGSWKYVALGTIKEVDDEDDVFHYDPSFLTSHWKMFHDAVQAHRFDVLHEVLPRFGICAA